MRILFTGGATGGHFFPILAIIREAKRIADEERILNLQLFYMGPDDFGRELLREEGVRFVRVRTGKWQRYFSFGAPLQLLKTCGGIFWGLWKMVWILPDVVFSKGGYGSLPAVVGAIILRIPLIIHESDAIPGRANLWAAPFAARIGIAFTNAQAFFPKEKTALVGIPLRKGILGGSLQAAKENYNIFSDLPVIGVLGGSQGAQPLNETTLEVLRELTEFSEVVHQTGPLHREGIIQEANLILEAQHQERYHPFGFLDEAELRDFYLAADVVVSRAGASTIFEIAAWGKPCILIPLSHAAQDHQRANAYTYAAGGAAIVIEETNLTPHILLAEIKKILENPALQEHMRQAAQRSTRIDAGETIARELIRLGIHEKEASSASS